MEKSDLEKFLKPVGENIRRIRIFKGFSHLEDFAKLTGFNKDYLGEIERGQQNFTIEKLIEITKSLDVSLEEIFQTDGNLLSLRFVISEHNITTLKEVIKIIKDLCEKKED